jgi:cytochrome c oxidase subunit 2
VPGQYTSLRFTPTQTGTFDIFCAEFCGTSHSGMIGKVHVVEPDQFKAFLSGEFKASPVAAANSKEPMKSMAELGAVVYKTKTCNTCHSIDGTRLVGPTFKGMWGKSEEMANGQSVTVDENYFRESLMDPMKKIVKGYPPGMPQFRGIVSDEEMNQLIAYIKTLK